MLLATTLLFAWAGVAAWMDLVQRRVRWWWSILGLVGAGGYRLAVWAREGINPQEVLIAFVAVTASYSLWKRGWWGGADAKTAMTMVIAIPDLVFIVIVALITLVVSSLRLLARKGQRSLADATLDAVRVVRAGAHEGERFPLVAVMVGALPIYVALTLLAA